VGIRNRKKKTNPLPSYSPSGNERNWYVYCVDNDIRIFPIPVSGEIGLWKIGINIGEYKRSETPHLSPGIYTKDNFCTSYYQMCKYYYDKREK
jgi:hypothetical protein|tara:strand:+ start:187 stop:465 length:279 start_codon:yes stop_codon:yes gene_type:complete